MVLDKSAADSGVKMDVPTTCQSLTTQLLFVGIAVDRSESKTRYCLNPDTNHQVVVGVCVRNPRMLALMKPATLVAREYYVSVHWDVLLFYPCCGHVDLHVNIHFTYIHIRTYDRRRTNGK
eukprot:scaffold64534_cov32-Attheya_sp.AAC.1